MAFITVISTPRVANVDFGIYGGMTVGSGIVPLKRAFSLDFVVFSLTSSGYIEATTTYNELTFPISYDGAAGTFKVESVDGATPIDNNHLYNILVAMKG